MRIYLCAWPRSGTKHLGRMISSALGEGFVIGLPISRGGRQPDRDIPAVCQTHFSAFHGEVANGDLFIGSAVAYRNLAANEHLIWNVRDPRDTAISLWKLGTGGGWLSECTLAEYLKDRFCAEVVNAPDFGPSMSWGTYTRGWMEAYEKDNRIIKIEHELTMASRMLSLQYVLVKLDANSKMWLTNKNVRRAVAPEIGRLRLSYDGKDDYILAGQPEWENHFGSKEARILDAHCGDVMRELGYGQEPEWLALVGKVAT